MLIDTTVEQRLPRRLRPLDAGSRVVQAGVRTVPAGALAFFKGGSQGFGHVMISLGGGNFASTDVGTDGRYHAGRHGKTTIALIESSFHDTYLGWSQPWFNH